MMPALVAVSLCGVLIALPDAQAQASETCVKEARAALEVDSPTAFGPEAIVEGPKTIATVEREELANIAKCSQCPETPFGYQYPEWEQFKRLIRPGDCLMFFRSNPCSWAHAFGSEGYVLVREGGSWKSSRPRFSNALALSSAWPHLGFVISLLHLTEWDAAHWCYALRSRHAHSIIGGSAWQSTLWRRCSAQRGMR